jgi:hypothetical protein
MSKMAGASIGTAIDSAMIEKEKQTLEKIKWK